MDNTQLYESLKSQIDGIKLDDIKFDDNDFSPTTTIVEQQKVYFWTRVYLNNEINNIESGDDIKIKYIPLEEELIVKFVYYAKKGIDKDLGDNVINYSTEDDKRVLCLMVDSTQVNYNDSIKFLRTLFKQGNHYDYQLLRRQDLDLIHIKSDSKLDYYDIGF